MKRERERKRKKEREREREREREGGGRYCCVDLQLMQLQLLKNNFSLMKINNNDLPIE